MKPQRRKGRKEKVFLEYKQAPHQPVLQMNPVIFTVGMAQHKDLFFDIISSSLRPSRLGGSFGAKIDGP
jgi:hypothetical protein